MDLFELRKALYVLNSQYDDMPTFSQRKGIKPIKKVIQRESMDDDLRIGLWNALDIFWDWARRARGQFNRISQNHPVWDLFKKLWVDFFKWPLDTLSKYWPDLYPKLREEYFKFEWNEVYDFVEFVANNCHKSQREIFVRYCNHMMERELSAYRFVGNRIVEITSKEEIAEIEKALMPHDSLTPVTTHLETALKHLANKKSPDYRNSIKESISAVEAICEMITGSPKASLGECLKNVEIELQPALREAFRKLYGYTSSSDGIRHAMSEEADLSLEDARFMLISCSAFVNYLKVKASKAGIEI